ncbi:MAG: 50S ribosomal protein L11 methyltransferase, partial [Clostridiales bacterium]|nr:50S ribosomal protein L11 methyltransferase [Clostridiales bacterium]
MSGLSGEKMSGAASRAAADTGGGQVWTEVVVKVPTSELERTEAVLHMQTPLGLYVEDYSDLEEGVRRVANIDLIDETLLQKDRGTALIHVYFAPDKDPEEALAEVRGRCAAAGIEGAEVSAGAIAEEDWANNWKRYFKPLRVGKGILIKPEWEELGGVDTQGVKAVV